MELVTDIFQKYRILARSIWNNAFWLDDDLANWQGRDQFDKIKALLFESLVELRLKEESTQFLVIPRAASGIPIQIEQPRVNDRNRYWDHPIKAVKPEDVELAFIDYFDWNPLGCLDFAYLRVKIISFPSANEVVGREALVYAEHAEICLGEGSAETVPTDS